MSPQGYNSRIIDLIRKINEEYESLKRLDRGNKLLSYVQSEGCSLFIKTEFREKFGESNEKNLEIYYSALENERKRKEGIPESKTG